MQCLQIFGHFVFVSRHSLSHILIRNLYELDVLTVHALVLIIMSAKRKIINVDKLPKKTKKQTSLLKYAGFSKEIVHNDTTYKIVDSGFVAESDGVLWKHSDNNSPKSEAAEKIARYISEKQQIAEEKGRRE